MLEDWLQQDLRPRFEDRILPVNAEVADTCGRLIAQSESKGRPIAVADGYIAATAVAHGLTLVTRDVSDFEVVVKSIFSPWSRAGAKS